MQITKGTINQNTMKTDSGTKHTLSLLTCAYSAGIKSPTLPNSPLHTLEMAANKFPPCGSFVHRAQCSTGWRAPLLTRRSTFSPLCCWWLMRWSTFFLVALTPPKAIKIYANMDRLVLASNTVPLGTCSMGFRRPNTSKFLCGWICVVRIPSL